MLISSIFASSCKPMGGTDLQENATAEPIMALSMLEPTNFGGAPPIAQDFILQQLPRPDLNGNNMLFKAVFKGEDANLRGVTSFPINVSEGAQVLMHDDGRNGDDRAGDFIFSASVKDDPARLTAFFNEKNATFETNRLVFTTFSGRNIQKTNVKLIDVAAFNAFKPISLGSGIASALVTLPVFNQLKDKSLMITDISVVQDPTRTYNPCVGGTAGGNSNGVWTLKSLMTNMANTTLTGVTADDFVKSWLNTEVFGQKTISSSGDITTPPVRDDLTDNFGSKRKFIAAWLKNSGLPTTQASINNWQNLLVNKLEFLPVRLLAIVNRLDLRGNLGYGSTGTPNGGEGRFVFCFMDSNNGCTPSSRMTIILEYAIPITDCNGLKNYGQQWYNLKNMNFGTSYNTALENITNVFTAVNAGSPLGKPNKSALNHLRTNEFIQSPWNIRDFEIKDPTHKLTLIHPNKEPMREANALGGQVAAAKLASLVAFANANTAAIQSEGPYTIPTDIQGVDAQIPSPSYIWNGNGTDILSDSTRHKLSLNTCSSCHGGETKTFFTHIQPTNFGTPAGLSAFLTGLGNDDEATDNDSDPIGTFWIADPAGRPAGNPTKRGFNDLFRRANSLETLINTACGGRGPIIVMAEVLRFQPLSAD